MRAFVKKSSANRQPGSVKSALPGRLTPRQGREGHSNLYLQRAVGNQALQRLLQSDAEGTAETIRTKLAIRRPGDEYEQEADRVAEQVMRMPAPQLQRT